MSTDDTDGDLEEARRARRREYGRAYREANADRLKEKKREWVENNRERHNAHGRATAARKRQKEAQKKRASERSREWAKAHPEQERERKRLWIEKNRERVREQDRASYQRNIEKRREQQRTSDAQRRADLSVREQRAKHRQQNREHLNELQRQRRAADPEASRRYNREWKQRERRRVELGLPKVQAHRSTKNDRAVHERDAAEFFGRRLLVERRRRILSEGRGIRVDTERQKDREERSAHVVAENAVRAFLAHHVMKAVVDRHVQAIHQAGRREEIRMDLVALRARGGPSIDIDAHIRRIATKEAIADVEKRLGVPIFIPKAARISAPETTAPDTGPVAGRHSPSGPLSLR